MSLTPFQDEQGKLISHLWPEGRAVFYQDSERHLYCPPCANQENRRPQIVAAYTGEYKERCSSCGMGVRGGLHRDVVPYLTHLTIRSPLYVRCLQPEQGTGYGYDRHHDAYLPMRATTSGWYPYLLQDYGLLGFRSKEQVEKFFRGEYDRGEDRIWTPHGRCLDTRVVGW